MVTSLALALMLIVVFFTMLLVVRQRAREIGTLKAMGASNAGIVIQIVQRLFTGLNTCDRRRTVPTRRRSPAGELTAMACCSSQDR
jgi:hypothetical protein